MGAHTPGVSARRDDFIINLNTEALRLSIPPPCSPGPRRLSVEVASRLEPKGPGVWGNLSAPVLACGMASGRFLVGVFRVTIELGDPQGRRFEPLEVLVGTGASYTWVPA